MNNPSRFWSRLALTPLNEHPEENNAEELNSEADQQQ